MIQFDTKKKDLLLILFISLLVILLIFLPFFLKPTFKIKNIEILKIYNLSKIIFFFTILIPSLIFYLLFKNYYLHEEYYFFEFISHFTTYMLFGFPFLILSFMTDLLFNPSKKTKNILNILLSLLTILLIDFFIHYIKNIGYFIDIFILIFYSYSLRIIENNKNVHSSAFLLFFYSIYIFSIDFLRHINAIKDNYYFSFLLFSYFLILIINLLNLYFNLNIKSEKIKNKFIEKLNELTFNSVLNDEKFNFFVEISKFLSNYIAYDLLFIGIANENNKKMDIIFAIEKEKVLKPQTINLANTITSLALKSKKDYTYFEDISKIPDTMYSRLQDSQINTKSFLGIPISDKYKRKFAIFAIERESKEKIKKNEIDYVLSLTKNIQFILSIKD